MDNVIHLPPSRTALAELWQQVLDKHLNPEDNNEVVALLESFGWTDNRARFEFGVSDLFLLAEQLRELNPQSVELAANPYREREPIFVVVRDFVRQFLRGVIFALPMVISIAAMLTLRFSLWSYQYLSTRTATAIAIGTLLSFLTVGGFMQAMARQGYFYMFQGHYQMMRKVTLRLIGMGIIASLVVSVVGILLDVVLPELPFDMLVIAIVYYLVLNAIWLAVAVLYILRREVWFTVLLTAGIGLVYVFFRWSHWNILVSQLAAMIGVAVGSLVLLRYFFARAERKLDKGISPPMPRASVTLYNVAPYFLYGVFYFALLFCDRVMAWSTHQGFVPLIIWFRGDYELGLDFALVVLIVPMGVSEIVVSRLMGRIWASQKDYPANERHRLNEHFSRVYRRNVLWMAALSFVNAVVIFMVVHGLLAHSSFLRGRVSVGPTTHYVFVVALVSYTILAIGLLHAVVMFSVSRPDLVLRPILAALLVNFTVGFLLTRWISYPQAVWGLFAGSVCFAYWTTRNVQSVLHSLDYHMYLLS